MYKAGSEIKGIIEEYKKFLLARGVRISQVILYGSYARGQQKKDSDIDLIVVSEDFQKMDLRERLEVLGIAAARIMKPIEARGYTPAEVKSAPKISFLSEVLRLGLRI